LHVIIASNRDNRSSSLDRATRGNREQSAENASRRGGKPERIIKAEVAMLARPRARFNVVNELDERRDGSSLTFQFPFFFLTRESWLPPHCLNYNAQPRLKEITLSAREKRRKRSRSH